MEKLLTSSTLIIEMWQWLHDYWVMFEVGISLKWYTSWLHIDSDLSHFINNFCWELTSWEVDLVGVGLMGMNRE